MAARLSAFVIWALVAGCVAFWGLRLLSPAIPTPSYAVGVGDAPAPRGDLSRLLGPDSGPVAVAQPAAASRFALSGVLSPKEGYAGGVGVALISVDGRPARAYQIGSRLVDDYVLQGVTRRSASLGPAKSGTAIVLELPERPAPATGTLPTFTTGDSGQVSVQSMPSLPVPSMAPAISQQNLPVPQYPPPLQVAPEFTPPVFPPIPDGTSPSDANAGVSSPGPQMGQGPPRRNNPQSR